MGDEQPLVAGGDKGFTKRWKILVIVNILVLIGLTIIVIYYSVSVSNLLILLLLSIPHPAPFRTSLLPSVSVAFPLIDSCFLQKIISTIQPGL